MSFIKLCRGDAEPVAAILKENGTGANLTGSTVKFIMWDYVGNVYSITCVDDATVDGTIISKSEGGVTIPFTKELTNPSEVDEFSGKFIVTLLDIVRTFPSNEPVKIFIRG